MSRYYFGIGCLSGLTEEATDTKPGPKYVKCPQCNALVAEQKFDSHVYSARCFHTADDRDTAYLLTVCPLWMGALCEKVGARVRYLRDDCRIPWAVYAIILGFEKAKGYDVDARRKMAEEVVTKMLDVPGAIAFAFRFRHSSGRSPTWINPLVCLTLLGDERATEWQTASGRMVDYNEHYKLLCYLERFISRKANWLYLQPRERALAMRYISYFRHISATYKRRGFSVTFKPNTDWAEADAEKHSERFHNTALMHCRRMEEKLAKLQATPAKDLYEPQYPNPPRFKGMVDGEDLWEVCRTASLERAAARKLKKKEYFERKKRREEKKKRGRR